MRPSFLVFCLSITAVMKYPTERRENKFSAKEMNERLGAVVINWHKSEHESIVSRFLGWSEQSPIEQSFPNVADYI